ncbi:MAG: hypothetical protein ABRQ38_24025 [Candidatus Eremiobacterota bacterium]
MKKIILIILFSFSILIAGNSALIVSVAGSENHKHSDGETCSECEKHSEKTGIHKHSDGETCSECEKHSEKTGEHKHSDGETCSECEKHGDEAEGHEEGGEHNHGDSCGVAHHHDRFILDAVLEQPWRHPEKLRTDMWLMRIAPLSFLFLLAIALRPAVNKFMKKVGK